MRMPNAFNTISNTATNCNSAARARLRKAKSDGSGGSVTTKSPHQVLRRNERERKRVQQVNLGFIHLRDRVPHSATSKKLSKVETLREAARYIKHLQDLLQGTCDTPFEPLNSTIQEAPTTNCREPCSSHENHYPVPSNQMPVACQFNSGTADPWYYQPQYANSPPPLPPSLPAPLYYKSLSPSLHFNNPVVKSENDSPNTSSSSYSSSSLSCTEITRFQPVNYVLS